MRSYISAPHTIAKAFSVLEPFIGGIHFVNERSYTRMHGQLSSALDVPFVDGCVSIGSSEPINLFLRKKGFSIQMPPLDNPMGLAVAGIVDMALTWCVPGSDVELSIDGRNTPAANFSHYTAYSSPRLKEPIFSLESKEGIKAYFTKSTQIFPDDFLSLQRAIAELQLTLVENSFEGVIIPHIDLDIPGNIDALSGLSFRGGNGQTYLVSNAIYQGILKLNAAGARAKAAAAMSIYATCVRIPRPYYRMDGPFWAWFSYLGQVYFASHVFPDTMRTPSNLD